jgi:signal transduction histidine kinase
MLVRGDPHYLGQMLTNLIENGIKYSSGSGKRVYVELASEEERWGVVRVQDDGPGVSEEHLPYLFERFYRVDKARSSRQKRTGQSSNPGHEEPGGTGLGLSIVQWIVRAHGGEIRVESTIGAGTFFEVRLPLATQWRSGTVLIALSSDRRASAYTPPIGSRKKEKRVSVLADSMLWLKRKDGKKG